MARRQTLMVRALTEGEREVLEVYSQSYGYMPFAERRSRILYASSQGKAPLAIAAELGVDDETVRRVIRAFNERGLSALKQGSPKPHRTGDLFIAGGRRRLLDILRRQPKDYGFRVEDWTLELIADAAFADGLTRSRASDETIRLALIKLEIPWGILKRHMRRERRKVPSKYRRMITVRR
jgi:transposase